MIASPEGFPVKQGVGTGVLSVRRRGRGERSGLTAVTEHARGFFFWFVCLFNV